MVSVGYPDYCFNWDLFIPYAYVEVFRDVTWCEETQFEDATLRDNGLISRERLTWVKGIRCFGETGTEGEMYQENKWQET